MRQTRKIDFPVEYLGGGTFYPFKWKVEMEGKIWQIETETDMGHDLDRIRHTFWFARNSLMHSGINAMYVLGKKE